MACLDEFKLALRLRQSPTTDFNHMAGVVGNFAVIGTYANNGLDGWRDGYHKYQYSVWRCRCYGVHGLVTPV
jgi:hypothetical protein